MAFAGPPLAAAKVLPNIQAHLSPFSWPDLSVQAFRSGSETVSTNSWATTLAIASPLGLEFGDFAEIVELTQRPIFVAPFPASPTHEY